MTITRRTWSAAVVGGSLLAALGGTYWRFKAGGERNGDGTPAVETGLSSSVGAVSTSLAVAVSGAAVLRDTLVIYVDAAGEAEAVRAVALSAEVGGPVADVHVSEGSHVRAGQLLVRIDARPYELASRQAEASLAKARARFAELTLFDGEIPDPELRAARAQAARVRAGLEDAEVELARARLDLTRASLRAPFDGRVANLKVVPGQLVTPGDSICRVVDLSKIRVEVQALESEIVHLAPGRAARIAFSALPDRTFIGQVATINPVVDPRTRTARVTVTLPNPDTRVRPGMYARVGIAARLYPDRVIVSREAILERDRRKLVFLFEPESTGSHVGLAKWVYVSTGLENDQYVEIVPHPETTMLEPGQVVLVEGHVTLTHDAKVRIVGE